MRYAAIDIGSNAIRLFIADIHELDGQTTFKRNTLVRVPLRLGDDVFLSGRVSKAKSKDLIKTMSAFRALIDVYHVTDYLAYATSAMRESENGPELVKRIKEVGIDLQIVDGDQEAKVIYSNQFEKKSDNVETFLYIDVGGGSTELSVFHKRKLKKSKSFKIGTIRLLEDSVNEKTWMEMRKWIEENTATYKNVIGIGTGGNIARISTLANQKTFKPLTYAKLKSVNETLRSYSLKERIVILGLKPDRADVIIPASEIFLKIMKWGKIKQIEVPQIGVVDGIIQTLIDKNNEK
jgi:exopolyphosphatase/guanosine-5'-triphosphate,3'-diphosphate pyrophosphatase